MKLIRMGKVALLTIVGLGACRSALPGASNSTQPPQRAAAKYTGQMPNSVCRGLGEKAGYGTGVLAGATVTRILSGRGETAYCYTTPENIAAAAADLARAEAAKRARAKQDSA